MTAWLSLCRVSHKAASVGRVPGQAGPALGVEGTAWSDRGWAAEPGFARGPWVAPRLTGLSVAGSSPPRSGCLEYVLF